MPTDRAMVMTDSEREHARVTLNRYMQEHRRVRYYEVLIYRADLERLRELEKRWDLSRVKTVHRLLDLGHAGGATGQVVTADRKAWLRIEAKAHRLNLKKADLITRLVELISWLDDGQLGELLGVDPTNPKETEKEKP